MPTTKLQKVEASISTEGRFRNGDGKYVFRIYDAKTNATVEANEFVYTRRSNAKRGAERFAVKHGYTIVKWVK